MMAIVKMKFTEASTDREHLDEMLMRALSSGKINAVEGAGMISEDNGGVLLSEENPYSGYLQTLDNFAHAVSYTFDETKKPKTDYTDEEIQNFLNELNEKFGITSDAEQVILTPDDEKAMENLSECGFERIHACKYLDFGFGRLPRESFPKLSMYRDVNFVHHRLYENKQYIWMVYVTSDSFAGEVKKIFDSLYFEPMEIPSVDVNRLLSEYKERLDDIYAWCSYHNRIIEDYRYVAQFDDKYVFAGFVRADELDEYKMEFSNLPVEFTVKEPVEVSQFKCPTLLKNGWFARPFELFVEMYSLPAYADFDPTLFFAITYCLLFGIMFSDMGQGLVLMVIGFLFEKKKGRLFGVIGRCGIFSTIFGFLFGSFFGYEDLLTPIHEALFHTDGKLFDVMANENTMTLLMGALVIGAVLIVCSQCLNIWNNARQKKWEEVLFSQNGIAGLIFYGYLIVAAGMSLAGLGNLFTAPLVIVCIVLPCVCFLMKEPFGRLIRHESVTPRGGWGNYVTQSIFEVLEILLSFVTNSMSYLRVGGFVLSHAGMMLVVMTLMSMVSHGGIAVLIFGNAFVMLLEGLVVGIQSLRLEYYEMFSRYYTGGGVKYEATAA
jgi:V/A-type H+-transporting ATPase subunit I